MSKWPNRLNNIPARPDLFRYKGNMALDGLEFSKTWQQTYGASNLLAAVRDVQDHGSDEDWQVMEQILKKLPSVSMKYDELWDSMYHPFEMITMDYSEYLLVPYRRGGDRENRFEVLDVESAKRVMQRNG